MDNGARYTLDQYRIVQQVVHWCDFIHKVYSQVYFQSKWQKDSQSRLSQAGTGNV